MRKQIIAIAVAAVLALLGVIALVAYAQRADDRANEGTKLVKVLQATKDVPAKTAVGQLGDNVEVAKIPKSALVPGAISTLDGLDGLVTSTALVPGDQLTKAKFAEESTIKGDVSVPKGMQELTIAIDGARLVGGVVKPGDKVGVFTSYSDGSKTANPINDLLVLKVTNGVPGTDDSSDKTGAAGTLVTFAVKTLPAQKIVNAMEFGKVWLSKQNDKTDTGGGKTITSKDVAP